MPKEIRRCFTDGDRTSADSSNFCRGATSSSRFVSSTPPTKVPPRSGVTSSRRDAHVLSRLSEPSFASASVRSNALSATVRFAQDFCKFVNRTANVSLRLGDSLNRSTTPPSTSSSSLIVADAV